MYNVLQGRFDESLKREGKQLKDFFDNNIKHKAFFRKNNDKNLMEDKMQIFYPRDNGIYVGQLLRIDRGIKQSRSTHRKHKLSDRKQIWKRTKETIDSSKVFMVLNQETDENDVYFKSDCISTNDNINFTVELSKTTARDYFIPAFGDEALRLASVGGSVISSVGGNMMIRTTDNEISRQIQVNQGFYCFDVYWKVVNIYFRYGIAIIYVERDTAPPIPLEPKIIIKYEPKYYHQYAPIDLEVTPKLSGGGTELTILNADLRFFGSDDNVAVVDPYSGQITTTGVGEFTFSAYWVERDVTESVTFQIIKEDPTDPTEPVEPEPLVMWIDGEDEIKHKRSSTYRAWLKFGQLLELPQNLTWTITSINLVATPYPYITKVDENTITVTIPDQDKNEDKKFILKAEGYDNFGEASSYEKTITIVSLFG